MSDIKAGYQVTVTSWENDGDNYNTKIVQGLTQHEAKFMVRVLGLFGHKGEFGNDHSNYKDLIKAIIPIFSQCVVSNSNLFVSNSNLFDQWRDILTEKIDESDEDYKYLSIELLDDYLGCPGEYYDASFYRYCESIEVHQIPTIIEDVTNVFLED